MHKYHDEYHFIIKCPLYQDIRTQYIKKCYYIKPSMAICYIIWTSKQSSISRFK